MNTSFNFTIVPDLLEEEESDSDVDAVMIEGGLRTSLIGAEENSSYGTFQSDSQDLNSNVSLLLFSCFYKTFINYQKVGRLDKFWSLLSKFANLRFDFTFGVGDVPLLQKRSCFAFFD